MSGELPAPAALTRVGVLERRIGASLERVWENVLDWEHLPWLHHSAFAFIERLESGAWGWRARAASRRSPDRPFVIELRIERDALRYVARTTEGDGQGTEIWTALAPEGPDATRIEVAFWLPFVPPGRVEAFGERYIALYTRLWDEDEAMMQLRQARLDARAEGRPDSIPLGPLAELRARLPLHVETVGARFRVLELDGELVAHSTVCAHMLGPLDGDPGCAPGEVRCPWHGYRFDVRTGRSTDGRRLRLAPAPSVVVEDGEAALVFDSRAT